MPERMAGRYQAPRGLEVCSTFSGGLVKARLPAPVRFATFCYPLLGASSEVRLLTADSVYPNTNPTVELNTAQINGDPLLGIELGRIPVHDNLL